MTHSDAFDALTESLAAGRLDFLRVELQVCGTLLDAADGSRDDVARARRRARAQEAHDEVARHLAKGAMPGLTAAQWTELTTGLAALSQRLGDRG